MNSVPSFSSSATGSRNKSSQNTLLYKHMDYFVERGIFIAWASANARSVTAKEATELLGYWVRSDGIWFEGANGVGQFRPDTRWKDEKGKLVGKFLSPSRETSEIDIFIPNHPTDLSYWETENLKKACYQINDHPHIVTTEGPAKAIAGCAKGIPTIAVSGVHNGLTGQDKDPEKKRFLVPTLRKLAEAEFGFIIAYDADLATNPSVGKAERTLAAQLGKFKVPVRSVTGKWVAKIEGKDTKGMDDFIHHRGIEEFRAILSKAKLFGEGETHGETPDTGDNEKTKKPPTARKTAQQVAEHYQPTWKYDNEQKTWRIWNNKCWQKTEIGVFTSLLQTVLDAKNVAYPGSAYIEDVRKLLENKLRQPTWQTWDKSRYINFNNCVFDGAKGESIPHSPGMGFTSHLPYDYKPLAGDLGDSLEALRVNCPKVHKFLRTAMKGNERKMFKLLAIINALLKYRFFDLQMFVHLVGAPGSGKGKFMRFCQKLVGKANTIACQLDKLGDGSTKASLMDKQLVVFPDERRPVGIDSILSLTGGDEISYRELYQPAASAHFYGSIMIASNKPIFIGDTTGLERRLCLVNFDNPIATEKRDYSLEAELDSEIPACIAIALSLTDDAVTQAIQGIGTSRIAEYKAKEWEMKTETNSVATFFDMELVLDPTASTPTMKLFDYYKDFCESGGFKPLSLVKFPKYLAELLADENLGATWVKGRTSSFEGLRRRREIDEHPTHSEYLASLAPVDVPVDAPVVAPVKPLQDKGLHQLHQLDPKTLTQNKNEDDYLPDIEESDLDKDFPPATGATGANPVPVRDATPASTGTTTGASTGVKPPQFSGTQTNQRRALNLANEMREAVAGGDRDKAKEIMRLFEASTPQIRGFFNQSLTSQEKNAASLLLKYGFSKGTRVKYVGSDPTLNEQYGDMELVIHSHNSNKTLSVTCRKPDDSLTTWLKPDDLRRM